MPTGGVTDITAPKAVKTTPDDNTINFNANTFSVEFNEYIELDNVTQKLIVSPPLNSRPEVSSRLNKLIVKWKDSLKANTTYIFDFSNAVKDYTEGNKMSNFSYSFSTGNYIDSLSYSGKVIDAFTLKPVSNKLAMLYNVQRGREIMRTEKPDYITRLDTFGVFRFRNLAEGAYNLIILDDKNQNFIYDLPTEAIAFSPQPITPTLLTDSVIKKDSLPTSYFFEPKDSNISIENKVLLSDRKLQLVFSNPAARNIDIKFENDTSILKVFSVAMDTLICYAIGEKTFDTLRAEISLDTVKEKIEMYYSVKRKPTLSPTFTISDANKELDYFNNLRLNLPFPCKEGIVITTKIICDSVTNNITLISKADFLESTELLPEGKHYNLVIDSGTLCNMLGQTNDLLSCFFAVTKSEDYGKISLTIEPNGHYTVLLESVQGKVITQKQAENKVIFDNIKEDKYKIKIIHDTNNNGKWDTGNFDTDIQPEKVEYFEKILTIRKNWEIEETMIITPTL